MKSGLRSRAAGVKSRQSGDSEVIITKRSMAHSMNRQDATHWDGSAFHACPLVVVALVFLVEAGFGKRRSSDEE